MIQFVGNEWADSQPCDGDIVDFVVILHNNPRTSPLNRGTEFYVLSIFLYGQGFTNQERNSVLCTQYLLV